MRACGRAQNRFSTSSAVTFPTRRGSASTSGVGAGSEPPGRRCTKGMLAGFLRKHADKPNQACAGQPMTRPRRSRSMAATPHPTGSPIMTAITTQHASVAWIALDAAERFGPRPALTSPRSDPITYAQLGTAVREIAGGLSALGVEPGDNVAILSSTRPEWTLADYGILAAGATVVPIYPTNSPEECAYVLGHSGSVAVICEDAEQLAKVERIRSECPALTTVVL